MVIEDYQSAKHNTSTYNKDNWEQNPRILVNVEKPKFLLAILYCSILFDGNFEHTLFIV